MGLKKTSSETSLITSSSTTMKRQSHQIGVCHVAQSEALKCPRCDSANTKFCYYNNYNKSQPRHFCRACKRHWTRGGTLRNVPVGGARKNSNKRLKKSSPLSSSSSVIMSADMPLFPSTTNAVRYDDVAQTHQSSTTPFLVRENVEGFGFDNNNWNYFEDIDNLVSADHIALPWEDYSFDLINP